jgi:hypothetical protein
MTPDLSQPYSTRQEREEAREALVYDWRLIELLMSLADFSADQWTPGRVNLLPVSPVGRGYREHPLQRLERWLSLYGDEIKALREVRNRIVHAQALSDPELRGADFIARVILATLFERLPTDIDRDWVKAKIAEVWQQIAAPDS